MTEDIHTFREKGLFRTKTSAPLRVVLSLRARDDMKLEITMISSTLPFSPTAAQPVCACQTANACDYRPLCGSAHKASMRLWTSAALSKSPRSSALSSSPKSDSLLALLNGLKPAVDSFCRLSSSALFAFASSSAASAASLIFAAAPRASCHQAFGAARLASSSACLLRAFSLSSSCSLAALSARVSDGADGPGLNVDIGSTMDVTYA